MRELSEAEVLQQIEAFYNYGDEDDTEAGGDDPVVIPDGSNEDVVAAVMQAAGRFPGFRSSFPGSLREDACDD
ncbi:MAG: hypothetical protein BWY88_01443 [Synergistetes bacterium ADurb.Bin520]|nr:MAG: hypothetical protein BWY88_01443 [Synergistetes bacterium ADurb.Bin520]